MAQFIVFSGREQEEKNILIYIVSVSREQGVVLLFLDFIKY